MYLKYKNTYLPLSIDMLGKILSTDGQGLDGKAMVQWMDGHKSVHPVRDLISLTMKLEQALHDVERFSRLVKECEEGLK